MTNKQNQLKATIERYNEKYSLIYFNELNFKKQGSVWYIKQETILENMWLRLEKQASEMSEEQFYETPGAIDLCIDYTELLN